MTNRLYYGDNLVILRQYIPDTSVDLIYLDPPFNSARNYNVLFKDESGRGADAQITAFADTWHWGPVAEALYHEIVDYAPAQVSEAINSLLRIVGRSQMGAYLVMMAARLVELHRVLKPTGSLYLHCDPTASHYLKIVLDTIFGAENFLNEIIWKRTSAHSSARKYGPVHDTILVYVRTQKFIWNDTRTAYEDDYLDKYYRFNDGDGRLYWRADLCAAGTRNGRSGLPWRGFDPSAKGMHWKYTIDKLDELDAQGRIYWPKGGTGMPQYKRYRDELKGKAIADIWDDIDRINPVGSERLGYPTQKPQALLERIIKASSNPGDVVLDPFCGCGTAVAAAQALGRQWIGIDITHLSIALLKYRLQSAYDLKERVDYRVIGEPEDLASAHQLAQDDRYQFQFWALSLVRARPLGGSGGREGKKGSDRGIDGVIFFQDEARTVTKRMLVQVKSGKVKSGDIRDLKGTMQREKAELGLFITLEAPSREMITEAVSAGYYRSPQYADPFPRLQIMTIEQLLERQAPQLPSYRPTFKDAPAVPTYTHVDAELPGFS